MILCSMFASDAIVSLTSHSPLFYNFIASAGSPRTEHESARPKALPVHKLTNASFRNQPILICLQNSQSQLPPNHILTKKVVGVGSNHQVTPPSDTRRGDSLRLRLLRPTHVCRVAKLVTLTAKEAKGYSRRDYILPFSLEVL